MRRAASRQGLLRELDRARGGVIAELGVFAGDFAAEIIKILDPLALVLVDSWQGDIICGDQHGENMVTRNGDELYAAVVARFARDQQRTSVVVHRRDTAWFRLAYPHETFDLIYIDADHEYSAVAEDLRTAGALVKRHGYIAGHDYGPMFPGVVRAVDDFVRETSWRLTLLTKDGCPSYVLEQ